MGSITRRDWLKAGLGVAVLTSAASARNGTAEEFAFHHDHVIGTSLDLHILAPNEATAIEAEQAALAEIERLRQVLSVYDAASEVSRLSRSREPKPVCSDLAYVLKAYDQWHRATHGAISGQLGELTRFWKHAEAVNELPAPRALERVVHSLRVPGWSWENETVTPTGMPFDLNALGKAYIIGKVAEAIRRQVSGVSSLLINLGGDVLAWGGWAVGIQNPFCHYDNAAPLAGVRLHNQAIASSGGYQRFYTIGGQRYSHVLDPRNGQPAGHIAGATVIATDAVTANALATTLCVLSVEESLQLVATVPGAECLIVATDGSQFRSPGLPIIEVTPVRSFVFAENKAGEPWPEGYQVTVALELPKVDAKKYRKPYVAVWIEDDKGKAVRTLGVWGNAPKYLKDLSDWWKIGKDDKDLVKAVAKATRGPGKYDLAWDGKDDKGIALPQGTYTVRVEVHREHGAHLRQSGKIECRSKAANIKLEKNDETAETVVEFKKPEKK